MRKKIIAGNWKMFKNNYETKIFFEQYLDRLFREDVDIYVFTPFTDLKSACDSVCGTQVKIGAQNMHYKDDGAFTGEISADMLRELGVECVLIGHSERRKYFGESNETVNLKLRKALEKNLIPIMCIGEDLEDRENGRTFNVIEKQLDDGLKNINSPDFVIAYEPIWAIGTGKTATNDQAEDVCFFIREHLRKTFGNVCDEIRILYGGSVKPTNIVGLMFKENIDGVLVGGASLTEDFVKIVNY